MLVLNLIIIVAFGLFLTRLILRCLVRRCTSTASMEGKVIIVTGANSGIGFETAKNLAARGGRVILACRNEERVIEARNKIIKETGNNYVVFKQLDLSSLTSVRRFAKDINATEEYLHVLVNNAGAFGLKNRYTEDGIVEPMQVNYFGPFLLTLLLIPLLKNTRSSRIVNVSSLLSYLARLNLKNINKEGWYSPFMSYVNSKLCNIIFTIESSKRLKDAGVIINAVHPGAIRTNIDINNPTFGRLIFWFVCWLCFRSAEEGCQSVVYSCVAEECAEETGNFYVDCKKWYIPFQARKKGIASGLWQFSEDLVNFKMN